MAPVVAWTGVVCSTTIRMNMAPVCQPLAMRPPNMLGLRRFLIQMEGLWVELPGVLDDLFPRDFIAPEAHHVADLHVLEVLHAAAAGRRWYIVIPTTATTTSPRWLTTRCGGG